MILPVVVGVQMTTPAAAFFDGRLAFSTSTDKLYDEVERLVGVQPGGVMRVVGSNEILFAFHRHVHVDFSKICSNSLSTRGLRLVTPELWGAGWRVGYDRIPHGKATIWANAYSIRFDFREWRGIWKLTSVRHEKPSDSSS